MCEPDIHYVDWLAAVKAKGAIRVVGATPEEVAVIKAALNLYRGHNAEKHVYYPELGWGAKANIAEELEIRME